MFTCYHCFFADFYNLTMGQKYNLYSFTEAEIQKLLTSCYNRGEIDQNGIIRKQHLRSILRVYLERQELGVLDPDLLGPTLKGHDYLNDSPPELGVYNLKLEKFVKKDEPEAVTVEKPADVELASIGHKRTFRRDKVAELNVAAPVCLICSSAVESVSAHLKTCHTKDGNLQMPVNESSNAMEKLFDIKTVMKGPIGQVSVLLTNIYMTGLTINQVQLVSMDFEEVCVLKGAAPVMVGVDESVEFTMGREYFQSVGRHFYLFVHAEKLKEYLEIYRFTVENTVTEIARARREGIESEAELSWSDRPYRFRRLPDHPPDAGLLKLFTPDFSLSENILELNTIEYHRYKHLAAFSASGNKLTAENYIKIMQILVEIEDLFENCTLRRFNIPRIKIQKHYGKPCIDVADITDFPETIQEGDTVMMRKYDPSTGELGVHMNLQIWKIADACVYVDPDQRDRFSTSAQYHVQFKKDRTTTRMEQEALQQIEDTVVQDVLFPHRHGEIETVRPDTDFVWFDTEIGRNAEQQQAVKNIVNGSAYPAPYIIFGPPGTGKTSTMVESILQIHKIKPDAHILVTAPSNFACDEIATRLLAALPPDNLFRYYSRCAQKRLNEISDELILISNLCEGIFRYPSMKLLKKFRIIIMTVVTAGRLALNGLEKNYFEYIFLDECGSATEPSAIIPISSLVSNREDGHTHIVLAGDPKQLGPIVACDFTNFIGLGKSLLERLMEMDFYKPHDGKYNEKVITKLLQNFRSHPAILCISNQLFYNEELIPKASSAITDFAINWTLLPNKAVPMIFHAVEGKTRSSANSFSLCNEREIDFVVYYVREIVDNGVCGLKMPLNDIGVVSPYHLQCQKIKDRLKREGLKEIEVGSAEQFQGKEKAAIVLSTVRSNTRTTGFLNNPKRLNVVITRAKGLLVIIGNPTTLQMDLNWFKLIEFCKKNEAVKGMKFELQKPNGNQVDANGNIVESHEDKYRTSIAGLATQFAQMKTRN